jgi:two-component system chemotaxis response regulator CheY
MPVDLNMNILIVDDDKSMVQIVASLLRELGFRNISQASDGPTALTKLRERSVSLIISDRNMRPMTGLQLLQQVRADETLKDLPFIMITAESSVKIVRAAGDAAVSNYLLKPFNAKLLKQRLVAVLGVF